MSLRTNPLIQHEVNQGVGGAIATGYKWCREHEIDVTVVMAGDAQMDPADLPTLLEPVIAGTVDYAKGNRLFTGDARYGQPNDLLVRLNVYNFRVRDVPVRPVYNIGKESSVRPLRMIPRLSWLLFKLFIYRMVQKYVIRDFHPLLFFYLMGVTLFVPGLILGLYLVFYRLFVGTVAPTSALFAVFLYTAAVYVLVRASGHWTTIAHAYLVLTSSLSVNYVTPVKFGIPLRIYLYKQVMQVPLAVGTALVALETWLGMLIPAVSASVGIAVLFTEIGLAAPLMLLAVLTISEQ